MRLTKSRPKTVTEKTLSGDGTELANQSGGGHAADEGGRGQRKADLNGRRESLLKSTRKYSKGNKIWGA